MLVQAGLCRTCLETTLLVFPRGGSFLALKIPSTSLIWSGSLKTGFLASWLYLYSLVCVGAGLNHNKKFSPVAAPIIVKHSSYYDYKPKQQYKDRYFNGKIKYLKYTTTFQDNFMYYNIKNKHFSSNNMKNTFKLNANISKCIKKVFNTKYFKPSLKVKC